MRPDTKRDRLQRSLDALVVKGATGAELFEIISASWDAMRPDHGILWTDVKEMIRRATMGVQTPEIPPQPPPETIPKPL